MPAKASSLLAMVLLAALAAAIDATSALAADGGGAATTPFESATAPTPSRAAGRAAGSPVDKLVFARLDRLGIQPANVCSDAVFVRRAFLDVIGTLPTEREAREFLESKEPDKRSALIDRLLARDEFAGYWAMKWSDLLRVKAEYPINLWPNAAQAYHRWIRTAIKENRPYDRFARELLTASGSNFRCPPVNFYRAMQRPPSGAAQAAQGQAIAQAVALTFMGARAESWPKERLAGLAAFFAQVGYKYTAEWKEEIVYCDSTKPATQPAVFPDGAAAKLPPDRDPREVFADWLIDAKNPWFARAVVNRIWYWLLGRGIIHEPDDIRLPSPDNPPSNPELLACLEGELVRSHYDLKAVYRLILNSTTYQLSSIPRTNRPQGPANFSHYPLRRLEAEVLIDALNGITGTAERYSSPIPEPFTFIPENFRSIELPDGSIGSSFLEMFGRPARDSGLQAERNDRMTAAQRLYLLNSSHIQGKIEQGPKLQAILRPRNNPRDTVTQLYLTILSRFPTQEESKIALAYVQSDKLKERQAAVDVAWALINSAEFLYRH